MPLGLTNTYLIFYAYSRAVATDAERERYVNWLSQFWANPPTLLGTISSVISIAGSFLSLYRILQKRKKARRSGQPTNATRRASLTYGLRTTILLALAEIIAILSGIGTLAILSRIDPFYFAIGIAFLTIGIIGLLITCLRIILDLAHH